MPLIGCDGIQQETATKDININTTKDIVLSLPSDDASNSVYVKNSSTDKCIEIFSDKSVRIYGNLYTDGKHIVSNSEEMNIGDRIITMNADIEESTQNSYGGLMIKSTLNTSGQILIATAFNAGTSTMTISGGPGVFVAGMLIYIKGSKYNDGLYKIDSIGATSLIISTSATEYDVQTSLTNETGASAKISEASPSMIVWDSGWYFGYYITGAVRKRFQIAGVDSVVAEDYGLLNPNLGCRGTSNTGSGSSKIGIYNTELTKYSSPTTVQEFAKQTNDTLANVINTKNGSYIKSGFKSIGNGVDTVSVDFSTESGYSDFSTNLYSLNCTIENSTDATPTHYTIVITAKSKEGFTIDLSSTTDSANYTLSWIATGD